MNGFINLSGCVTTLRSISGKSPNELEDALGFNRGALKAGYWVFRLAEAVGPSDFQWKDTTRYSNGWTYDPECNEWIQRADAVRWDYLNRNNGEARKGDAEFDGFIRVQEHLVNVRTGWLQIVKVRAKAFPSDYPDSHLKNIPQWSINGNRPKRFTLLFD